MSIPMSRLRRPIETQCVTLHDSISFVSPLELKSTPQ